MVNGQAPIVLVCKLFSDLLFFNVFNGQVCGPGQPKDLREIVSDFPGLGEVDYIQHGLI